MLGIVVLNKVLDLVNEVETEIWRKASNKDNPKQGISFSPIGMALTAEWCIIFYFHEAANDQGPPSLLKQRD